MATDSGEIGELERLLQGMMSEEGSSSQAQAILKFNEPFRLYNSQRSSAEEFPPYPDEYLVYGTSTPPPLNHPMCANYDPVMLVICPKEGAQICGGCQMVRYCSKVCQRAHWPIHKKDCKSPLRSPSWQPAWLTEKRTPAFINNSDSYIAFGSHLALIGNMPAIDILNLENNEGKIYQENMSLAFVASGDLRNVMRTVNELPSDYQGVLKIVLNDSNPIVTMRNIFLLFILAKLSDVNEAAEHALHAWYSAFLPAGHSVRVLMAITSSMGRVWNDEPIEITSTSTLRAKVDPITMHLFMRTLRETPMNTEEARRVLHQVMMAPEREDYRDRFYVKHKPSHRLAHERWLKTGLLLPFGAVTSHMTWPNRWLFTPDGKLAMKDTTSPIKGWDLEAAFESGKAHGTTSKDILGCMYYYVKDQLAEFARRLRRFNIQIHVFDTDACNLPPLLEARSLNRFDRIEVSNIIDHNYVGLHPIIKAYAPLLNPGNKHSAIIGLFMNWPLIVKEGRVDWVSPVMKAKLVKKYTDRFPVKKKHIKGLDKTPFTSKTTTMIDDLDSLYNHLPAFEKHLKVIKEEQVLDETNLKRRDVNRIVPHRLYARLGSRPDALPDLESDERWYYCNVLSGSTTFERYTEWTRK